KVLIDKDLAVYTHCAFCRFTVLLYLFDGSEPTVGIFRYAHESMGVCNRRYFDDFHIQSQTSDLYKCDHRVDWPNRFVHHRFYYGCRSKLSELYCPVAGNSCCTCHVSWPKSDGIWCGKVPWQQANGLFGWFKLWLIFMALANFEFLLCAL